MVNNMREQLVRAGYAQNSRLNMQKKVQQFDFENFDVVTEAEKAIKELQYKDRYNQNKIEVDCKCKLNKIYQATISVEYTLSRKVSNSSSGL